MGRPSKVYLLMHASGQSFKIGIAVQTYRRAAVLPDAIDMARSLEADVTTGRAEAVEKILHYICRDLNTKAERIKRGEMGDGYTEWFAAQAFEQARSFIDGHAEMLGVTTLRPVQLPIRRRPLAAPPKFGGVPWSREERVEYAMRQNTRALQATVALLASVQAAGKLLGSHIDERGNWEVLLAGCGVQSWRDKFLTDDTSLWISHVQRGGGYVFTGTYCIHDEFAYISISSALRSGGDSNEETPYCDEFRHLFSTLLPYPSGPRVKELESVRARLDAEQRETMKSVCDDFGSHYKPSRSS